MTERVAKRAWSPIPKDIGPHWMDMPMYKRPKIVEICREPQQAGRMFVFGGLFCCKYDDALFKPIPQERKPNRGE